MRRTDLISAGVLGLLGLLTIFVIIPRQVTQDVGFGDLFGWGCAGVLGIMTAAAALRRPRVNRGEGLIRRPR